MMTTKDCYGQSEVRKAENNPMKDLRNVLETTENYLRQPTVWAWVNYLAETLQAREAIYAHTTPQLEQRGKKRQAEHSAKNLIEWMIESLYERETK